MCLQQRNFICTLESKEYYTDLCGPKTAFKTHILNQISQQTSTFIVLFECVFFFKMLLYEERLKETIN